MSRSSILNYVEEYSCTQTVTTTITKRVNSNNENVKRARFQESTTKVIRNVGGSKKEEITRSISAESNFYGHFITSGSTVADLLESMSKSYSTMYPSNQPRICDSDRFTDVTDTYSSTRAAHNNPLAICDVIDLRFDDSDSPKLDSPKNSPSLDTENVIASPKKIDNLVLPKMLIKSYTCFLCQCFLYTIDDQANHLVSITHLDRSDALVKKGESCKLSQSF